MTPAGKQESQRTHREYYNKSFNELLDDSIEDAALICERAARQADAPGDVIALSAADYLLRQLNPRWYRK